MTKNNDHNNNNNTTTDKIVGDNTTATTETNINNRNNNNNNNNNNAGRCCWYLKYGKCEPPRPPCRFNHDFTNDDGITPCCFGATCRLGHAKRVTAKIIITQSSLKNNDTNNNNNNDDDNNNNNNNNKSGLLLCHDNKKKNKKKNQIQLLIQDYWEQYNAKDNHVIGKCPAERDATKLRSQLEPWSTAILRQRLATVFNEDHSKMDLLNRGQVMEKLLQHYEKKKNNNNNNNIRKTIQVLGTKIDYKLCQDLLIELQQWSLQHTTNTRPSIKAECYMILRSPRELQQKLLTSSSSSNNNNNNNNNNSSNKMANKAIKKLQQYQTLWDLAQKAIESVDIEFAKSFSALAVTKNFVGSPHIDKQNTGPFYGLALGNFTTNNNNGGGGGGICVEVDAFTIAHVHTKNQLSKVDGRYPHWVAPYNNNDNGDRYSLIYYSTWQEYIPPGPAYFGTVVVNNNDN